jgi:signal peptidase I
LSRFRRFVFGENPRRTTVRVLVLAAICFITFAWVLTPVWTDGTSMLPTYKSGRYNLVNRLAYQSSKPDRGDVIAIKLAGPRVVYIKRIVGLPGERVAIAKGIVHINGVPLVEPYVRHFREFDLPEETLKPGEYYAIGDNRIVSDYGRIELGQILGRVVF